MRLSSDHPPLRGSEPFNAEHLWLSQSTPSCLWLNGQVGSSQVLTLASRCAALSWQCLAVIWSDGVSPVAKCSRKVEVPILPVTSTTAWELNHRLLTSPISFLDFSQLFVANDCSLESQSVHHFVIFLDIENYRGGFVKCLNQKALASVPDTLQNLPRILT